MDRWYFRNWYWVNAGIAALALVGLAIWWSDISVLQRLMLIQFALINLHFPEEFGFPGGFPMLANKLELHSDRPSHHPLNQWTVALGNNWFAFFVYLPAFIWPDQVWLVMSVTLFGFIELFMHSVIFNRMMHHWHNGGLWTSVAMAVVSVVTLFYGYQNDLIPWWSYILGLVYPMGTYAILFSWLIGKVWDNPDTRYPFSEAEMNRFGKWTSRALAIQEAHGVDTNAHTHASTPSTSTESATEGRAGR